MDNFYQVLLIVHSFCGVLALLCGSISALYRKGSKGHITSGKYFGILMLVTGLSAFALSILKPNPFLFGIGLFTMYLVSSGWIWIRRFPFHQKVRYAKFIGFGGLISSLFMVSVGFYWGEAGIVLFIFSAILVTLSSIDIWMKVNPVSTARLHGGRMGGAFIAAVTAFLVTNVSTSYPLLLWLGPTVIGSVLIAFGIKKYYRKKGA